MGSLNTRRSSEVIPADVLERARLAGAKDLDWYAGRLDQTSPTRGGDSDGRRTDAEQVVKQWKASKAQASGGAGGTVAKIVRFFTGPLAGRRSS